MQLFIWILSHFNIFAQTHNMQKDIIITVKGRYRRSSSTFFYYYLYLISL